MDEQKTWASYTPEEKKRAKTNLAIIAVTLIIGIALIGQAFGSGDESDNNTLQSTQSTEEKTGTLPEVDTLDYFNEEGLFAYKDLKEKGYNVDAEFGTEILKEINGDADDVFEPLDYNKTEDRLSVDAFKVASVIQDGDNIRLIIK